MVHPAHKMSAALNGNGHGANGLFQQIMKRAEKPQGAKVLPEARESLVTFKTIDGGEFHGTPLRITRHSVVFELYSPSVTPRLSEALGQFEIILQGKTLYSGSATVRNVLDTGTKTVCETILRESDWTGTEPGIPSQSDVEITKEFKVFFKDWQRSYKVSSDFKLVMADMQTFLHDLRLWLERVELKIRVSPKPLQAQLEMEVVAKLAPPIIVAIDVFINQFESIVTKLKDEEHPCYYEHLRRQLHPLVLVSPFARRAFGKPLGYAGDYLMVDMMIRSPIEGDTLFAKIVNVWLLGQSPAQAHRNRVSYLEKKLIEETARVRANGSIAKIFNLGCGPAAEVQRFFAEQHVCGHADLSLVDFNEETLQHLGQKLNKLSRNLAKPASFRLIKKSVNQILKDAALGLGRWPEEKYDYVYCAGLFDYLSDNVCRKLMNVFYEMLAPGGLLLATNATDVMNSSRPFRYSMEYILDWHLIYRDKDELAALSPNLANKDDIKVVVESTGANLFLEVKKSKNV